MRKLVSLLVLIAVITLGMGFAFGADNPQLIIKSPKDGSTLEGGLVVVQFETKNFKLENFTNHTAINNNEGHIHMRLDDNPYITHAMDIPQIFGDVSLGPHTLTLWLVHNNHTPLDPPVKEVIHFTMGGGMKEKMKEEMKGKTQEMKEKMKEEMK